MPTKFVQEIPVLIASTLKSSRDTRAFEKFGISLHETNKYSINIIGFSDKRTEKKDGINFYSSLDNTHSLIKRLLAQWRFLRVLLKIKPKILICSTYEYLPIAKRFKDFVGYKLIYDVQENYLANLNLNPELSSRQKERKKKLIQRAENTSKIDLFFLAEKCYSLEMPEKIPYLILENKYAGDLSFNGAKKFEKKDGFRFIISGTLTPAFGVIEGVNWFLKLLEKYPQSTLTIVGHIPLKSFHLELKEIIENRPQIIFKGSDLPLAHQTILANYSKADFALTPYQDHPEIRAKIPSKFFESIALSVPILHSPNENWSNFLKKYSAGYAVDFSKRDDATEVFQEVLEQNFFPTTPDNSILWKSDEDDFLKAIERLLHS